MHIHPGTHTCFQEAEGCFSPEEEPQGAHVAQVHSEHTADLLQSTSPLWLIPARRLQEAIAVREPQVGIGAGGGAGGGGGVRISYFCAMLSQGKDGKGACNIYPGLKYRGRDGARPAETATQMSVNDAIERADPITLRIVILWFEWESSFCLVVVFL